MHTLRLVVMAPLALAAAAAAQPATFQGLGFLPGGASDQSNAMAISPSGHFVVGQSSSAAGLQPVRWIVGGGAQGLGILAGYDNAKAMGVSNTGDVVGYANAGDSYQAFRWTASSGLQDLGFLPGGTFSLATGISADGSVAIGNSTAGGPTNDQAFRWTAAGGLAPLAFVAGAYSSSGVAISADGSTIVGDARIPSGQRAMRWTAAAGMQLLGDIPGGSSASVSSACSADGSVIVGGASTPTSAVPFRWTQSSGMTALPLPPGANWAVARACSADGAVIACQTIGPGSSGVYIIDAAGLRLLKDALIAAGATGLTGWSLSFCGGVSADGTVFAGHGTDPSGRTQAWIATLPRACYANCDGSTAAPILNINDFVCFQARFAAGDPYANCDGSTTPPILNVNDFICFQTRYATGCP